MSHMQYHSGLSHPCLQGVNDFHRVLRRRENTMVFLENQFHTFVFEPSPSAFLIKGTEKAFH